MLHRFTELDEAVSDSFAVIDITGPLSGTDEPLSNVTCKIGGHNRNSLLEEAFNVAVAIVIFDTTMVNVDGNKTLTAATAAFVQQFLPLSSLKVLL